MTKQPEHATPRAGAPVEAPAPAHGMLRSAWRMLFPLRFLVVFVLRGFKRLIGKVLQLIKTAAFRIWQGVARLFGRRVVYLSDVKRISMLGMPVLKRLKQAAAEGEGGILEVGPYIGGSTIAFALGHKGKRKHVVVEVGGRNPNPHLPSTDILRDLRRNLKRFGCEEWVTIVQGWSNDPAVIGPAMEQPARSACSSSTQTGKSPSSSLFRRSTSATTAPSSSTT